MGSWEQPEPAVRIAPWVPDHAGPSPWAPLLSRPPGNGEGLGHEVVEFPGWGLECVKVSLISPCSFVKMDGQVARNNSGARQGGWSY